MNITRTKSFFVSLMLATVLSGSTSKAGVILGVLPNPTTTAGPGTTSTRSGPGTWHIYAIEDAGTTDFGISSYNITLTGATAINHRSPTATLYDQNGDPQTAGFTGLRSATNANPIVASQGLPGTTPFLVTGFGQTAGDFCSAFADACVATFPPPFAAWGNYATSTPANLMPTYEASTGHKFVFIAEGTGNINITSAVFTVYSNGQGASVFTPPTIVSLIPEPATCSLAGLAMMVAFGRIRCRWVCRLV